MARKEQTRALQARDSANWKKKYFDLDHLLHQECDKYNNLKKDYLNLLDDYQHTQKKLKSYEDEAKKNRRKEK